MDELPRYTRELTLEELAEMTDDDIDFSDIPEMVEMPPIFFVMRSEREFLEWMNNETGDDRRSTTHPAAETANDKADAPAGAH